MRLSKVEEAEKFFSDTQQKIDDKMDSIYRLLATWGSPSEAGSAQKHNHTSSPSHLSHKPS
jgi:hypothetical protein